MTNHEPSDLVNKPSVSADLARRVIARAVEHAERLGKGFTIAVVDESGVLKAMQRMDGAPLISVQIARTRRTPQPASASRRTPGTTSSRMIRRSPTAPRPASIGS
jgi:uncharacterized protein GlcG (DUF336 family)